MADRKSGPRLVRVQHEGGVITLNVRDEADLEKYLGSPSINADEIHADVLPHVIAAGVMAIAQGYYTDAEGGAAKLKAIEEALGELKSGSYKPGRQGGTAETPSIILALHEVLTKAGKDLTIEQVEASWDAKDKTEKSKIARRPEVILARAKIDKEREAKRLAAVKKREVSDSLADVF